MTRAIKKPRPSLSREALDVALECAKAHGEQSEPDMEVGDLLELIEALFKHAPEDARRAALLEYADGREIWSEGYSKRLRS